MKLKDFYKLSRGELYGGIKTDVIMTLSDLDDVFVLAKRRGIEEMQVTKDEMSMIVRWFLANCQNDKNGNQAKVIREGKIDKFFGVNLVEI